MPMVTVWPTPNGLPIASTTSPTRVWSMRPSVMVGRLVMLIFSTARSVSGSTPITFALVVRPSASAISI